MTLTTLLNITPDFSDPNTLIMIGFFLFSLGFLIGVITAIRKRGKNE